MREDERTRWPAGSDVWRAKARAFLRRYGVLLSVAALCLLGAVLTYPHLSGLWHLETGGAALGVALGEADALDWWYVGPMTVRDSRALQTAIVHLAKATRHASALRLLGRARAAQGDLLAGIEALQEYTARRPESAAGHLELAAAYVEADRRLQAMYSTSLLEVLPGSAVAAPDLPRETHYQPEGWHSEFVYPTALLLPPDTDTRPTLFLHAGSQVTYTLSLTEPAVLGFAIGLDPRAPDWGSDGVTFEVFVDGARVFLEHLTAEVARAGWQERQVDLSEYAGQTVSLSLATTPGPVGDLTADWASWGDPRIEAREAAAYREVVQDAPWQAEWERAGAKVEDFVGAGEGARKAQQYREALIWYEWAIRLAPDLGDPWYHVGQLREEQERWDDALAAYQRALASDRLDQVQQSHLYYRSGVIYQWRLEPRQAGAALAAYEAALAADDFQSEWEAADCHYKRGETLSWTGGSPDEYITECERAIELNPKHVAAHVLLGVGYYARDRDVASAEARIQQALELSPEDKWAHYYLGDIYQRDGRTDEARAMYRRALEIDPGFAAAQERLQALGGDG